MDLTSLDVGDVPVPVPVPVKPDTPPPAVPYHAEGGGTAEAPNTAIIEDMRSLTACVGRGLMGPAFHDADDVGT